MPKFACILDTNYIEAKAFSFNDVAYRKLRLLAISGQVEVLSSSILVDEVGNRAKVRFSKAMEAFRKSSDDSYVLKEFAEELHQSFQKLSESAAALDPSQRASELYTSYLDSCNATVLPTDDVAVGTLFHMYFGAIAPFAEGKKRYEFVDAAVVNLLDKYHGRAGLPVHIVTRDGDYRSCQNGRDWLIVHESVAEMLDTVLDQNGQAALLAQEPIERSWPQIIASVEQHLQDTMTLFVEDFDGEVDVLDVAVSDQGEKKYVALEDDRVGVIVDVELTVTCHVTMADPDLTAWDKGPIVLSHRTGDVDREIPAKLQLEFQLGEIGASDIVLPIDINADMDTLIDVDPYELEEDPSFYH